MAHGVLTSSWVALRGRRIPAEAMVGIGPIRVISFLLIAVCGGLCQQQDARPLNSLPDAPSADQKLLPSAAAAADATFTREATPVKVDTSLRFSEEPAVPQDSSDFFERHVYPSLLSRKLSYHPSTSNSFMGRAGYAASSIFVTRDDTGRVRLNTSYLVGVLSSAVIHTAYRPYWRRSVSDPFGDFGSNIGNDAGMNLVHEFGPGIQQLLKSHAPRFVTRIEEHISQN